MGSTKEIRNSMKIGRKYGWPDDINCIPELDDEQLKKIRQYAPPAWTEHERKCDLAVLDEMMSRGLL